MSLGPFDLTGGPFLILYAALFAATVVAGFVIPRRLRPEGRPQRGVNVDQLAFLAGGRTRYIDALVARLLAANWLLMVGRKTFGIGAPPANAASAADRSVLALLPPFGWKEIELALKPHVEPIERKLVSAGLLMTKAELASVRFWAVLPYLVLLTFGATKWIIGDMRDRPVGMLTVALVVTTVLAIVRWASVDRRTKAGVDTVFDAKRSSSRLRRAPTDSEVGIAVALFGTAVLAGSAWSDFHQLRNANGSSSDGGGGSDGGSDGGGCGGGCGGCGS